MLIDPNDPKYNESSKATEHATASAANAAAEEIDSPPVYSEAPPSFDAIAGTSATAVSAAPKQGATNFVYVEMPNNRIKGSYIIDPTLTVPTSLLPPAVAKLPENERRHLHLFSKNGSVDADITVLPGHADADAKRRKRAVLVLGSSNGNVGARVRRSEVGGMLGPTPIHLSAASRNGTVRVHLPPSFTGPLTLTTKNGSIHLSASISAQIAIDTHDNGTRRCFVGDMSMYDEGAWQGDVLLAESHNGSVFVSGVEDLDVVAEGAGKGKGKGLFSRIFG